MKPRAKVTLRSEQSPEPVNTHGGLAVATYWYLEIEGVEIGREFDRRHWTHDREKYVRIEYAPRNLKGLFDKLCEKFDPVVEAQEPEAKISGRTLEEWKAFARQDDCLDAVNGMVPSDLRQLLGKIQSF